MKNLIVTLVLFCLALQSIAQESDRYAEIEIELQKAVEEQDFELAASLKKERSLRQKIDEAVKNEDFETAAELKKELNQLPTVRKLEAVKLDSQIEEAVKNGDYEKAATLKKEKEDILSGNVKPAKADVKTTEAAEVKTIEFTPDFNDIVYLIKEDKLYALEKQDGEIISDDQLSSREESYYFINGTNSARKIEASSSFIVRMEDGSNPTTSIRLFKFDQGKSGKDRYVLNSDGNTSSEIGITFTKQSNDVYKIQFNKSLSNGEYGFKLGHKFFCFRVGRIELTSTEKETRSRRGSGKDPLFSHGFTLDFLFGAGMLNKEMNYVNSGNTSLDEESPSLLTFNLIIGTKFYFGSNDKFRLGLQANWFRFGNYLNLDYFEESIINMNPLNAGLTFVYKFKENVGIEAGIVTGMFLFTTYDGLFGNSLLPEIRGININPSIKFRYKKLSVGLDYLMQNQIGSSYYYGGGYRLSTIALNFGLKF